MPNATNVNTGNSGEYFVAGELERRGFTVAVPMSNVKDFDIGFTVTGKLAFHHVKGGVILVPSEFSIIEQKFISKFKY